MNRINRRVTALVAAAIIVPSLTGCFNGFNAGTQQSSLAGDGANAQIAAIKVLGAVWVRGLVNDGKNMTLVANFVNEGTTADELLSVTTVPASLGNVMISTKTKTFPLPPQGRQSVGLGSDQTYINAYNVNAPASSYITTTLNFKTAGSLTMKVLSVPPLGIYAGLGPVPATIAGAIGKAVSPSASASPSGSALKPTESASASPSVTPTP